MYFIKKYTSYNLEKIETYSVPCDIWAVHFDL